MILGFNKTVRKKIHLISTSTIFILFLIINLSWIEEQEKLPKEKPNVLMICVDDLNNWIGVMGKHPNAKTPNIDRLAKKGILFTNAHCQAPVCGPSRASIMSGLRPSTTGIYGQISDNNILEANPSVGEITFLPEYFKYHGYYTMGKGKIFHDHAPDNVFDESGGRFNGFGPLPDKRFKWDRVGTYTDWGAFPESDDLMPDYVTAKWAVERLAKDYEKPFFLAVGFVRPHVPLYVPQKWFDMHPIESVQTPPYKKDDWNDIPDISKKVHEMPVMPTTDWAIESGEWKNIVQAYLACVTFVDNYIGEVLEALENSKYKDNTIVVLWSDHGYRVGEKGSFAKHALWQEATGAPLIITMPNGKVNKNTSQAVELLDIYPTLLDLCGLPANTMLEGKSLKPLLDNPDLDTTLYAITTYGRNNHAVISDNYRYIRYENNEEEFYDHRQDKNEWDNKSKDPLYSDLIAEHRKRLPQVNVLWSPKTKNKSVNPYFKKQRKEQIAK